MKTIRLLLCALPLIAFVRAQDPDTDPLTTEVFAPRLTSEQLDQLLGPIALYPDALIAIILPACTAPTDVVLAARHLRENANDVSQVENLTWDDSVKSLAHYPDVLKWLDENLPWTRQVGEAFLAQPAEVMQSIQRLRAKARAAGTLVDTPQQVVMAEPEAIRIVPAQSDIIYVPYYDPAVVFVDRPVYYSSPFMTFSTGYSVGSWLAYDFDWGLRTIWVGNRYRPWYRHDWRHPVIPIRPPVARSAPPSRLWRPTPRLHRPWYSHNRDSVHHGTGAWQRSLPSTAPSTQTRSRTFSAPRSGSSQFTHSPAPDLSRSRTTPGQTRAIPATPRTHTRTDIVPPPTSAPVLPYSRGNHASSQGRGEARVNTRPAITQATPPAATPPVNAYGRSRPSSSSSALMSPVTPRSRAPGTLRTDAAGSSRTFATRTPRTNAQSTLQTFAPSPSRTHVQSTTRTTAPSSSLAGRVASPPPSRTPEVKSALDGADSVTPAAASVNRGRSISGGSRQGHREAL